MLRQGTAASVLAVPADASRRLLAVATCVHVQSVNRDNSPGWDLQHVPFAPLARSTKTSTRPHRVLSAPQARTQAVARQTAMSAVLVRLTPTRTLPHRALLVKAEGFGSLELQGRLLRA